MAPDVARTWKDFEGWTTRLTAERLAHILEHPEMRGMTNAIGFVLAEPEHVRASQSDADARLYYRFLRATSVGDKYVCIVVKVTDGDAFVVTAYLTDTVKRGHQLWPIEN